MPAVFPKDTPAVDYYGFIELEDGMPAGRFVYCSPRPILAPVAFIGWCARWPEDTPDNVREDWDDQHGHEGGPECGVWDFRVEAVMESLAGAPFEADNNEDAREEAQGNWA
jgi:hypothetical protein